MQEAAEAIETENRESETAEAERWGPYDPRPDPNWWDEFYGEEIEP